MALVKTPIIPIECKIAEKLVFGETSLAEAIDLVHGVKFMLVNRDCKEAFLSQFSLNKTFLLHGGDQAGYTRSSCLMDRETCYINVEKDKWLVALLIQNKVFKPKNLTMTGIFNGFSYYKKFIQREGLCAMQRFSFLFGLNEGGLDLSDYTGPMLALNSLKVNDTVELDKLMALDPINLEITLDRVNDAYTTLPDVVGFSSVDPTRLKDLTITHNYQAELVEFSAFKWYELLSYVMSSCANLKNLHLCTTVSEPDSAHETHKLDNLFEALKEMKEDFLPKLLKDGCCIEVDFVTDKDNHEEARFYNQDCFLIGDDKSTKEEDEICYVVEFDNRAKLRLIFQNYGEAVSGEESG